MKASILLVLPAFAALVAAGSDPRDADGSSWGLSGQNPPGMQRRQRHHGGRQGWRFGGWRWNRPRPSIVPMPIIAPSIVPTREAVAVPLPNTIESYSASTPTTKQASSAADIPTTQATPVEDASPSAPTGDVNAETPRASSIAARGSSSAATVSQPATPVVVPVQVSSGWNPPADIEAALAEVWDHQVETYNQPTGWEKFTNYGYDTIIAAGGHINFCVRWEDPESVTASQRQAIEQSLDTNVREWTDGLTGYEGWPYQNVTSSVVGWAVADASQLQGDTSGVLVHTTKDQDGIPECDPRCGRFFVRDGDYSECPGGAENHYDLSLWLTKGMSGGTGGDWGGRVGSEYFLANLENPHIWLHEFGHTLALDDFYDWTPTGITNFIMKAGASMEVTEFDIWMMRDWWRNLVAIPGRYSL